MSFSSFNNVITDVCDIGVYEYLSLSAIGSMYNTCTSIRDMVHQKLQTDPRLNHDGCLCNICDGFLDTHETLNPVTRYVILSDDNSEIRFVCQWAFQIHAENNCVQ